MEAASQNRKTVAAKIAELYARYPLDKFVWIMPRLDTASELPEHLDLMVQTRKFSSNEKDGDVYPQKGGGLSLRKSALMALAADAGIKWVPGMNRRLDDGSDPDVIEWQATGILTGLSGMTPVMATKRTDFAHLRAMDKVKYPNNPNKVRDEDLRRKEFGLENTESKAQLRVIRSILGMPHKFEKATIDNRAFAVLRVIFAPVAQTPRERELILQNMSNMYLGAYPGAETAGRLGSGQDAPVQISPHQVQTALPEASAEPVGGERNQQPVSPPADIAEAEVIEDPPAEDPPPPTTTDNFEFLKAMKKAKETFVKLLGDEAGTFEYYEPIHKLNFKKSNEIVDEEQQKAVLQKLRDRYDELMEEGGGKKEPASDKPPDDDMWQYKMLRSELGKRTVDELRQSLAGYIVDYKYDSDGDPQGLKELLRKETKGNLIEAHIRIMRANRKRGGQ